MVLCSPDVVIFTVNTKCNTLRFNGKGDDNFKLQIQLQFQEKIYLYTDFTYIQKNWTLKP